MELTFLTGNKGKLEEARTILGEKINLVSQDIDLDEVQEIDSTKIIIKKAQDAYRLVRKPLIIEDTSLYLVAWKGLPGALIKWFLKTVGCEGILDMLKSFTNRSAFAQTAIAYHDGRNIRMFESTVKGKISEKVKGENGFGWDNIFIPDGQDKTYAKMKPDEKNKISSRKVALEKLRTYLLENLNE